MQHLWQVLDSGNIEVSSTEQGLWNGAKDYFKWCDSNPIETPYLISAGKDAGKSIIKKDIRPYSIKGLCIHCGILEEWLYDIKKSKKKDSLYYQIVSRIVYIIYEQNVSLAMVGSYNPIMTAKILGMDREDDTVGGSVTVVVKQGLPELSNSENEVLEKLELEKKGNIKLAS